MTQDTIAAIATPPGKGGVAIIRISGKLAHAIAVKLTKKQQFISHKVHYCAFYNAENVLIDEGIVLYFKAPKSFTGEDVIELQGHGSPVILDYLLQQCLAHGARLAKPGEFSERAFLNDKIDLTQAEAIADLIQASSLTAARMAVRTLQGDFAKQIDYLNEKIIYLRLYVEAAIDFPEEEIDFLSDGKVAAMLQEVINLLNNIRKNAGQGAMLREGLTIVIAGKPNAGKSTLLNCLAGREAAIVTPVAGTTRDVMREHVLLDELPVHLIDTAGLRISDDVVEKEGIRRAWHELNLADCVLLVMDIVDQAAASLNDEITASVAPGVPIINVFNKIDTAAHKLHQQSEAVYISAKSGTGIELLKEKIKAAVGFQPAEGQYLARRRHLQALDTALDLLLAGQQQLTARSGELLTEDLRLAHQALGEITGEFTADDLLGRIFSSFCIGK